MPHPLSSRTGKREGRIPAEELKVALPNSPDSITLLHNPRCSKSRATLALLEERGTAFEIREYLEDPLTVEELRDL